jgi:uncharacterized membrane protein YbhN (UPF0104 family)
VDLKKNLKIFLKIFFTVFALFFIFQRVELKEILKTFEKCKKIDLFFAFVFFNFSKIISSVRLNLFFKNLGFKLKEIDALRLYYIGMFYNLFLPGGIGGDGYKIYLLKRANFADFKSLFQATLLDRISGLIPLIIFAGILFFFSNLSSRFEWLIFFDIFVLILIFPLLWGIYKFLFKRFYNLLFSSTLLGFLTQFFQLLSAYFIAKSLFIEDDFLIDTLFLFLISSIVAVLPISFGGIGLREGVFLYGFFLLNLPAQKGVAFGIIFFLITAISSFVGLFLKEEKSLNSKEL